MKKSTLVLSLVAAFSLSAQANSTNLQSEIESLKQKLAKLEKQVKQNKATASQARQMSSFNNIKWNIDFRTSVDSIEYTLQNGDKVKNNSLFTNRLWLGMKYAPSNNISFYGTLSYLKAYGDSANHAQANTNPGYADFDWVTNENALDNTIKVKEAYWLYRNDSFLGNKNISWTASIGRRPSTDGLGANFREDQKRKSALAHVVNVEFDGASFRFNNILPTEGSWIKFCGGRGLTNARPRFDNTGLDYSKDDTLDDNVDLYGVILVPYDNGQYSLHMNYAKGKHMIGLKSGSTTLEDFGDLDLATVMFKADGIGDEINDFLDDTIFFVSYAYSKTHPKNGMQMLGSSDSKSGHSWWVGTQMPSLFGDDGRFGIEYNEGSRYWRSVTYAEDTYVGSKVAARGKAWEVYYHKPLTKALSMSIRYTDIKYDYTGSNGFFGEMGAPVDIASVPNAVKEAKDIRAYIRYRF